MYLCRALLRMLEVTAQEANRKDMASPGCGTACKTTEQAWLSSAPIIRNNERDSLGDWRDKHRMQHMHLWYWIKITPKGFKVLKMKTGQKPDGGAATAQ